MRHQSRMERCLVICLVPVFAAALCACGPDAAEAARRYDYHPLSMDKDLMVSGCDGYTLGTVRIDRKSGASTVCTPLRAGCSDTQTPGCGEGKFAARFKEDDYRPGD